MSFRTRKPYSRPNAPGSRADAVGAWSHDRAPVGAKVAPARFKPDGNLSKLLVSNLHYEITSKDLSAIFGQIGTLVREPLIRYDRSGRSTGSAIVSFETPTEATRAKKQFDGLLAKGQPLSINYDTTPVPQKRRSASAPTSLLHRIQRAPLADRLSRDDSVSARVQAGPGPIRSRLSRGGKKYKTAKELDMELDAFMGDATPTLEVQQLQRQQVTASVGADKAVTQLQDIEMA